ncbi:MAG: PAS domain S-box protein [Candidatus Omnitrophota bacterium]|jgi:diguanylate cyclase (GGDEF)-like protein/PAS domain S-box-containing protein
MENQRKENKLNFIRNHKDNSDLAVIKLRNSEFQQKAILNNIPDIAWLKDIDGKFIVVNDAFAKACGFKAEEIAGKTDFDLWPKDLAESYRSDDRDVMRSKKRKCIEERLINKEDGEIWIETVKTPVFDDQGNVIGTTGIARNISQRKKEEEKQRDIRSELEIRVKVRTAELTSLNENLRKEIKDRVKIEEELLNAGTFLHGVFSSIQDGLSVLDTEMNVLRVNPTKEKWHAHNMPLVGKKCYFAFHGGNQPCDECPVEETIRTLKPSYKITAFHDKDKNILGYLDLYSFPMFDEKTKKLIGVIEYARDITKRKNAEEALQISEERFRTIADFTYDWEYWQGTDNKMIYVSPSCERVTGYTQNDFLNDPDLIEKIVHEDDIANLRKKVKDAVRECVKLETDFRIVTHSGQIRWLNHVCVPIYNKEGKLLGRRASNRDVTRNKEYENELRVYREKLELLVDHRTKELESEVKSKETAELQAKKLRQQIEFILGATKTGLDIIDENYCIRYIDPEWAKTYGPWEGKFCFDYFMDRKTPCPDCALEKAFKTKKTVVSQEVLVKEGNRPISVTTIPFQDDNGEWLVAEVNIDISERLKIEEGLRRYREHLEEIVEERTVDLLQEVSLHKKAELEKSKLHQELLKSYEKLKSISLVDSQTGLYNRRYLQDVVEVEFKRTRSFAHGLAIIMLDIDYFKSINDVYGIAFGDLVLKQLSRQLKRMVRRYDTLIRYSGEEFLIISPRLNRDLAFSMAQRLLESLNFINFGNNKHSVRLKLSLAAVSFPEDRVKNGMDLVNLANMVLNKAKEQGGNRAYSTIDMNNLSKKSKTIKPVGVRTLKKAIDKLTRKSKQGLSESIFAFAKTIELKDHYTGEHVENTVHYATEIAKCLNLPQEDVELIKQAAMLHDLGKIGISENILLKKGKLNKKEFEEIKKHPQIGADIIRPIQFLHALIPFIFYHHERWDGKGYPSGIKGEDIPIGARIIAIADVYQALISDRPYHKAFTKAKAIDMIKKASGTQFDPRIVSNFLTVIKKEK